MNNWIMVFSTMLILSMGDAFARVLRVIPWDHEVANRELAIASGPDSIPLGYLHPDSRSEAVEFSGEQLVLRLLDRKDEEGQPRSLAIKVPATIAKPLMLLVPDKKVPAGLRVKLIDDSVARFGWGSFRVFNLSGQPLVFRHDRKGHALPAKLEDISINPGGRARNLEVMIYKKSDLEAPIYSTLWEYEPDERSLVFVLPSKDRALGPIRCRLIVQHKHDLAEND